MNGASETAETNIKDVLLFSSVLLHFIKRLSTSFLTLAASQSPSLSSALLPVTNSPYDLASFLQSGIPPNCTVISMGRCTSTCGPLETSLHPDVAADLLEDNSINSHRSIVAECLMCFSKRNSLGLSMNFTQ